MLSIAVDANIIFSALYNKEGTERAILDIIINVDEIQLFAPDVFKEEILRNLEAKLGFSPDATERLLSDFDIIEVPYIKYKNYFLDAKRLIVHESDIPHVAVALLLHAPIWSGNEKHFKHLENSHEIIWFDSRRLFEYLKNKDFIEKDFIM